MNHFIKLKIFKLNYIVNGKNMREFEIVLSEKWPKNTILYLLSIGLLLTLFIFTASEYSSPLGHDGTVYTWPAAMALADAPFLSKLKVSTAGFMQEDHLAPIYLFYSYAISQFSDSPILVIKVATKIEFLAILSSSIFLFHKLWRNPLKTLLFSLLLVLSLPMTWLNMMFPIFNLSIFLGLWCFYFLHLYLETRKRLHLIVMLVIFTTMTLSFETAFGALPLLAIYTIIHFFTIENITRSQKLLGVFWVGGLMFICFLPYLIIHQSLYGIPIPVSRLTQTISIEYMAKLMTASIITFSSWNFDIFRIAYSIAKPLVVIVGLIFAYISFSVVKSKMYSRQTGIIFICFCFQLPMVMITGRTEPGMWLFIGIIYLMMLTDVISIFLFEKRQIRIKHVFISLTFITFIAFPFIKPSIYRIPDTVYKKEYEDQTAAYQATNGPYDDFNLIQLPGATGNINPVAFWIGNKIFNHEVGLEYYETQNMLMLKNMNISQTLNPLEKPFSKFEAYLFPLKDNKVVTLTRDKNLFTRYMLNSGDTEILRSVVIPYTEKDIFKINLPNLVKIGAVPSQIKITLKFISQKQPYDLKNISVNGQPIINKEAIGSEFIFGSENLKIENTLVLNKNVRDKLLSINVKIEGNISNPQNYGLTNSITVVSGGAPCTYGISNSGGEIDVSGTIEANQRKKINILFLENSFFPIQIQSSPFGLNRRLIRSIKHTQLLSNFEKGQIINVCESLL